MQPTPRWWLDKKELFSEPLHKAQLNSKASRMCFQVRSCPLIYFRHDLLVIKRLCGSAKATDVEFLYSRSGRIWKDRSQEKSCLLDPTNFMGSSQERLGNHVDGKKYSFSHTSIGSDRLLEVILMMKEYSFNNTSFESAKAISIMLSHLTERSIKYSPSS